MPLRITNSLGRSTTDFTPRIPGEVSIYVCGPTVQSEPHVGHGRSAVAFDVIRRYLIWRGFKVTYVRNITDVEDKIIAAANEAGESMADLAEMMAQAFADSYAVLGVLEPDFEPKATDHISEIIATIQTLIDKGHAYASEGDVYFSVRSLESYGKLSGRNPDDLRSGYRIEVGEAKHDPLDFALWKGVKPGEPWWDSPWGPGRPGWHIECSAMASKYLGEGFDIHGGGSDLIFPHHENEVAQSEGASGETFARYWLHNGMVNLHGEKMAKSTGVLVDLATVGKRFGGKALRLLMLRAHYRSPIEYSEDLVTDASETLDRLQRFRERVQPGVPDESVIRRFQEAMDDDFGTPQAVSVLFDAVREGNRILDAGGDASGLAGAVEEMVGVFGLDDACDPEDLAIQLGDLRSRYQLPDEDEPAIGRLIELRAEARTNREFGEADAIRQGLEEAGVALEDGPDGTRWLRK